jgi:transcriptional regulator with XRE-family HTH domain
MASVRGDRIKSLRKIHTINQAQLAEAIHVNQNQISKYERGLDNPSMETLIRMAQVLGTTTDYLLGLTDVPDPVPPDLSPAEAEMVTFMRGFDEQARAGMVAALKALYRSWAG